MPSVSWCRLDPQGPRPGPRSFHTLVSVYRGAVVLVMGGRDGDTILSDMWAFVVAKGRWVELCTASPTPIAYHAACAAYGGGDVWVYGGRTALAGAENISSSLTRLALPSLERIVAAVDEAPPLAVSVSAVDAGGVLPGPRAYHSLVAVPGGLCLVGGYDGRSMARHVSLLDLRTHTWRQLPLSYERPSQACAVAPGCATPPLRPSVPTVQRVHRLDAAGATPRKAKKKARRGGSMTLTALADMQPAGSALSSQRHTPGLSAHAAAPEFAPRDASPAVSFGSTVVMCGGESTGRRLLSSVAHVAARTGLWSSSAARDSSVADAVKDTAPPVAYHCTWPVAGRSLAVFGGFDGKTTLNQLRLYDTATGVWVETPESEHGTGPSPRASAAAAVVDGGRSIVFGGDCDGEYHDDLWVCSVVGAPSASLKHFATEYLCTDSGTAAL